jgi:hypothetical protein
MKERANLKENKREKTQAKIKIGDVAESASALKKLILNLLSFSFMHCSFKIPLFSSFQRPINIQYATILSSMFSVIEN